MTITAAELHALFEPIRQRDGSWWPDGVGFRLGCVADDCDCGAEDQWVLIRTDVPTTVAADLILAAGLRWLAGREIGIVLTDNSKYDGWIMKQDVGDEDSPDWCGEGPTAYHALAAAMRAVLGMEPLAP